MIRDWFKGGRGLEKELLRLETIAASLAAGVVTDESRQYLDGKTVLTPAETFVAIQGLYRQALDIARQLGNRAAEAEVLYNLGRLYQDPPRTSLFLFKEMSEAQFLEAWDARAGVVHHRRPEDQRQALTYYHQALRLARDESRVIIEASGLVNIAVSHRHLGEWGEHRRYLEEAAPVIDRVGDPAMKSRMRVALAEEKAFQKKATAT
jgi:tetratricopeptide (TPR) repeat protein